MNINVNKHLDFYLCDRKTNHRHRNTTRLGNRADRRALKHRWVNALNRQFHDELVEL